MHSENPENSDLDGLAPASDPAVDDSDLGAATRSWEVEQKYVVQDAAQLERKLENAGFVMTGSEEHEDIYFRHPARDFRQTDEALRLRRLNETLLITYKGQRLDAAVKTRPEIELSLKAGEYALWQQLLQSLGFSQVERVRKQRLVFKAPESNGNLASRALILLDSVRGLGDFAEIELIVDDARRLQEAQATIESLAAELQLTDVQPRSYLSQILAMKGL